MCTPGGGLPTRNSLEIPFSSTSHVDAGQKDPNFAGKRARPALFQHSADLVEAGAAAAMKSSNKKPKANQGTSGTSKETCYADNSSDPLSDSDSDISMTWNIEHLPTDRPRRTDCSTELHNLLNATTLHLLARFISSITTNLFYDDELFRQEAKRAWKRAEIQFNRFVQLDSRMVAVVSFILHYQSFYY